MRLGIIGFRVNSCVCCSQKDAGESVGLQLTLLGFGVLAFVRCFHV